MTGQRHRASLIHRTASLRLDPKVLQPSAMGIHLLLGADIAEGQARLPYYIDHIGREACYSLVVPPTSYQHPFDKPYYDMRNMLHSGKAGTITGTQY